MSKGWMRVREAAALLSVSETTVRRRIAEGHLRGRSGRSGRQEVFVPAKLREVAEACDAATPSQVDEVTASAPPSDNALRSETTRESHEEQIKRYERLAGGSLMLAQKRADELTQAASAAYENLAHARQQLRQVRKLAVIGWATSGATLLLAMIVSIAFGMSSARSQARAEASQRDAAQSSERLAALYEELAALRGRQASDLQAQAAVTTD